MPEFLLAHGRVSTPGWRVAILGGTTLRARGTTAFKPSGLLPLTRHKMRLSHAPLSLRPVDELRQLESMLAHRLDVLCFVAKAPAYRKTDDGVR